MYHQAYYNEYYFIAIYMYYVENVELLPMDVTSKAVKVIQTVDIPPQTIPPATFQFPKRTFSDKEKRKRSCNHQWFQEFKWLSYIAEKDLVICHPCCAAHVKSVCFISNRDKNSIFNCVLEASH